MLNYSSYLIRVSFTGFLLFVLLSSCSKKITFMQSAIVPAVEGRVKIKTDRNNNYLLNIRVLHLADPANLPQPAKVYVVWITTDRGLSKNLGQLKTSNNFIKRALTASLETVTTFSPTRIFITAEENPAISYPVGQEVLSTATF